MEYSIGNDPNTLYLPIILSSVIGTVSIAYVSWFLFYRPLNIVQGLKNENSGKPENGRNFTKTFLVNKARQMRKLGDLPPPYPNSWFAVLESDELSRGQVKEIVALGRTLVAWRGKTTGKVYVSDPYCPHLGAHLGQGGTVNGDCIQCPFHLWSFCGETGKPAEIPYSEVKNLDNLSGLKLWHVVEANGFVYIWYHAQGHDPSWYPEEIPEISSSKWKYRGRTEFWTTCHIQEIPENGADVSHLSALHQAPAVPFGAKFLEKFLKHQWSAEWNPSDAPNCGHIAVLKVSHHMTLFGNWLKLFCLDTEVTQFGAGIVKIHLITPIGHGVFIQTVTPIEPLVQRITHRFYSESTFINPIALVALYTEGIQIARDIEIWDRKCYIHKPVLVKEDSKIKLFRRWFSQFYSETELSEKRDLCKFKESNKNFTF